MCLVGPRMALFGGCKTGLRCCSGCAQMTDRLVKWIGQQSLKRTFASIADDTGLDR